MYYEMELGGKKRGLKFNQISLEVFTKNINAEAIETSSIYATFYAGLVGNSVAKREEQDFTYEDVMGWVDKLYEDKKQDEIKKVCDVWTDTFVWKNFKEKIDLLANPITENKIDESKQEGKKKKAS